MDTVTLDFQLVLLRRMADHNPGLVDEARRTLGASIGEMREANKRWQAMVRSPRARGAAARYRSVLGEPESVVPRKLGDVECEARRWALPLWPDLRFEVLVGPDGAVWNEWLVRAPGATPATPRTLDDLAPWSCTVDEVARAFPRPVPWRAPPRPAGASPSPRPTGTAYPMTWSPSSPGACSSAPHTSDEAPRPGRIGSARPGGP